MRSTVLYLVLLVVLGLGVWAVFFRGEGSPFSSNEANFTVADTGSITRILLAKGNEEIQLHRTDSGWRLNDRYPVLRAPMNGLLLALHEQRAVAPVSKAAHNTVVRALAVDGIKVVIYASGDEPIRTFYVGNESTNYTGTYMLQQGADRPFVVEIPGFQGFLTPRYTPKFLEWRDRTVFNIAPEQIKQVVVNYPDSERSFRVVSTGPSAVVLPEITGAAPQPKRALDYLGFFRNLNSESYVNGTNGLDSIIRTAPPRASVAITTNDGGVHTADIYWMSATERTGDRRLQYGNQQFDVERYYAVLDRRDTVVIQEQAFSKVFQQRGAFFGPQPL